MISICFLCTTSLGITACSNRSKEEIENNPEKNAIVEEVPPLEKHVLVAYFSATGTTKKIAEEIAASLSADLYEIVPEQPYTEADLAYYTNGRADQEQADFASRPSIAGESVQMDQYDTILLGYPIWHGQAPKIIYTFLETYDFSNKTILPFCTSHSSGIGSSASNLHSSTSATTNWLEGERLDLATEEAELQEWLLDVQR